MDWSRRRAPDLERVLPTSASSLCPCCLAIPARNYNLFHMQDDEYDVVVVGSGGAGMAAALAAAKQGLSTVVIEKASHFGGSTARSGGGVWIPNNEVLRHDGVTDTPDAARTYLHSIVGEVVPSERI